MPSIRDTIARVAEEEGIDPAYALAVAERESSFDPNAHSSKTIHGLFQMRGDLRHKYGSGDSSDPETQTRAWARFSKDLRGEMASHLGRDPTDPELYAGHHFGGARAARIISGQHAGLSPQDVFSPYELSINPHLNKSGSAGDLTAGITRDIDRRMAKYGGGEQLNAPSDNKLSGVDFAQFGQPIEADGAPSNLPPQNAAAKTLSSDQGVSGGVITNAATNEGAKDIDFAAFGAPHEAQPPAGGAVGLVSQTEARAPASSPAPTTDADRIHDPDKWAKLPASTNIEDRRAERYRPSPAEYFQGERLANVLKDQRLAKPFERTELGAQLGLDDIPSAQHPETPPLAPVIAPPVPPNQTQASYAPIQGIPPLPSIPQLPRY